MADVATNRALWSGGYDWSKRGEEWSAWIGGSRNHWSMVILPRIHAYLPASTILEIAPGFGRWTQYLLGHCDRLIGVDLSEECVESCRARFADAPHAEFHVNDGRTLDDVEPGSVDFAFSHDSLVHVETDVVE